MTFWAYMLRCSDGRYYTGHTDELGGRVAAHQTGQIPGFTQKRRPVRLVWSETFVTREEALAAERQVKNWSREKKEGLIAGDWERVAHFAQLHRDASLDAPSRRARRLRGTNGG